MSDDEVRHLLVTLDAEHGQAVSERLVSWYQLGLVIPFVLVGPDGTVLPESPRHGRGQHAAGDDPQSVLASWGASQVTVVSLHGARGPTSAVRTLLDRLSEALQDSHAVRRISIYAVASDFDGILGEPGVDMRARSFVLALEDRVSPTAMSVAASDTPAAPRLALAGVAIAGMFVSQRQIPAEAVPASTVPTVRLTRVFARLAVGPVDALPDLRDRVDAARSDPEEMARLVDGVPAANPAAICLALARQFAAGADGEALRYEPFVPEPAPKPEEIKWRPALKMLWDFVVRFVTSAAAHAAAEVVENAIRRLEARAQRLIFGADSAYRISLLGDSPPTDPHAIDLIAETLVSRDDLSIQIAATPRVWQQLRAVAFGLADAGPVPGFVDVPTMQHRRMVISEPDMIAPLPSADEERLATNLRACDPIAATHLAGAPAATEPAGETDSSATVRITEVTPDLGSWLAQRRDSFTWNVALSVADALDTSSADMLAAAQELARRTAPAPEPTEEEKKIARKRRRRRRIALAVVVIAVLGFAVTPLIVFLIGALALIVYIVIQAVVLTVIGARLVVGMIGWVVANFQAEHRLRMDEYELHTLIGRALHAATEYRKLRSSYQQLVEWSDVIAEVVHRPFGRDSGPRVDDRASLEVAGPLAWVVGEAAIGSTSRARLALACSADTYGPRWLAKIFEERAQSLLMEERALREQESDDISLEADFDVGGRFGRIRRLRDQLREQADRMGNRLMESILRQLAERPITEVFDVVTSAALVDGQPPEGFFDALSSGRNHNDRIDDTIQRIDLEDGRPRGAIAEQIVEMPPIERDGRRHATACFTLGSRLSALAVRVDVGLDLRPHQIGSASDRDDESHRTIVDRPQV